MRRLDRKQKDLLSDILSKIVIYMVTIALIKQILEKKIDVLAIIAVFVIAVVLTVVAVIIVREE